MHIWVRSRNCGCLVTWFCHQLIAKPGNKTAAVSWPDPYMLLKSVLVALYDGLLPIFTKPSLEVMLTYCHWVHYDIVQSNFCQNQDFFKQTVLIQTISLILLFSLFFIIIQMQLNLLNIMWVLDRHHPISTVVTAIKYDKISKHSIVEPFTGHTIYCCQTSI